jgi:hypothetical protein
MMPLTNAGFVSRNDDGTPFNDKSVQIVCAEKGKIYTAKNVTDTANSSVYRIDYDEQSKYLSNYSSKKRCDFLIIKENKSFNKVYFIELKGYNSTNVYNDTNYNAVAEQTKSLEKAFLQLETTYNLWKNSFSGYNFYFRLVHNFKTPSVIRGSEMRVFKNRYGSRFKEQSTSLTEEI